METQKTQIEGGMEVIETGYMPPSDKDTQWMYEYEEDIILQIEAGLRGATISHDKHKGVVFKRPVGNISLMNEQGIAETMSIIKPLVTKIQALTALKEERILQRSLNINITINNFFALNMQKFDLTEEKADIVVDMIMDLYESNLSKSVEALSMKLQGQIERRTETKQIAAKPFFRRFG